MTEIEIHRGSNDLAVQMDYARAVSSAALLPQAYRGKPADIMLAVGLGQSMGLSPAESLYRIDVIQGKPTASAELIAANVRKAGHKLRVRGDETSATATIVRSDDPDFEFTVTRDQAWAQAMGLVGKDNYKKQPGTMLQWRAITAVARLACPEALYGVAYTADEMTDLPGARPASGGLGAALNDAPTTVVAEQVHDDETGEAMTDKSRREMFALFTQKGVAEADQLSGINHLCGTSYESRGDLTEADCRRVIEYLRSKPDAEQAES
jgi:hypothetical protein